MHKNKIKTASGCTPCGKRWGGDDEVPDWTVQERIKEGHRAEIQRWSAGCVQELVVCLQQHVIPERKTHATHCIRSWIRGEKLYTLWRVPLARTCDGKRPTSSRATWCESLSSGTVLLTHWRTHLECTSPSLLTLTYFSDCSSCHKGVPTCWHDVHVCIDTCVRTSWHHSWYQHVTYIFINSVIYNAIDMYPTCRQSWWMQFFRHAWGHVWRRLKYLSPSVCYLSICLSALLCLSSKTT